MGWNVNAFAFLLYCDSVSSQEDKQFLFTDDTVYIVSTSPTKLRRQIHISTWKIFCLSEAVALNLKKL